MVNGKKRIRRLNQTSIKENQGNWIVEEDNIAQKTIKFFEQKFSEEEIFKDSKIMECIPKLITEEDNINLIAPPFMGELKDIIFSMNSQSALGTNRI